MKFSCLLLLSLQRGLLLSSAFVAPQLHSRTTFTSSSGLNSTTAKKKKKSSSSSKGASGGFSSAAAKSTTAKTPFDASSALIRSEKLYDELSQKASKAAMAYNEDDSYEFDDVHSEYLIAARLTKQQASQTLPSGSAALGDWVPVAQLCMVRKRSDTTETRKHVHVAVSAYCREIHRAAQAAAPIIGTFPRNNIQYSAEPLDSFFKFVYDDVIEQSKESGKANSETVMSKAQAREVLDIPLESTNDLSLIKRTYRTLSMQYHPDRYSSNAGLSDQEKSAMATKFTQVKLAYETLCSGIRNTDANGGATSALSWYESLGGRDRNEFFHIPQLVSPDQAKREMEEEVMIQSAVIGLDSETVMAFIARNLASSRM